MGDRANVKVVDGSDVVFLYTHWDGTELPSIVRRALARRQRWNDHAYLARIIFSEMIKGSIDGETGYGISHEVGDGGDRVVEIDVRQQVVTIQSRSWTFEDFIEADSEKLRWPDDGE